jgi:hypothetical protein
MTGWCVEAHDLAASKLVAFRDKDRDFVLVLIAEELVKPRRLLLRVSQLPRGDRLSEEHRDRIAAWVRGIVRDLGRGV